MPIETQTADKQCRINLPRSFANTTVIIEQISETEVRIRKTTLSPDEQLRFEEESSTLLSDRDRDLFLSLLDDPPLANEALKQAAAKYRKRHVSSTDSSIPSTEPE